MIELIYMFFRRAQSGEMTCAKVERCERLSMVEGKSGKKTLFGEAASCMRDATSDR